MQSRVYVLLASVVFLCLSGVQANNVTVGCAGAGGGPFDYASISGALSALHAISFRDHDVTISGTCSEYVNVYDFENLRLTGTPGAVILDPETSLEPTLNIGRSEGIEISNLTIRGVHQPIDLVRVFTGSEVEFRDSVIEQSGDVGMFISNVSLVRIFGTMIQDNARSGVRVAANSLFELGEPFGDPVPVLIQRNGQRGISADTGATVGVYASTTIQDNGAQGLFLEQATASFCCDLQTRQILRNGTGIDANQSNLRFIGPTRIAENRNFGIVLNHRSTGRAQVSSEDEVLSVADNGAEGIILLRNSEIDLNFTRITGNGAGGLVLRENSSTRVLQTTITGNGAEGIHLSYLSTMSLFVQNTIEGNQGFDVYCTPDSHALGQENGVRKMACPGFNHTPDPDPGGAPPED